MNEAFYQFMDVYGMYVVVPLSVIPTAAALVSFYYMFKGLMDYEKKHQSPTEGLSDLEKQCEKNSKNETNSNS
jgi:hypothetical protein